MTDVFETEGMDLQRPEPMSGQDPSQCERVRLDRVGPDGSHYGDGVILESSERVAQGPCGDRIEPLQIVDRQDDGAGPRDAADPVEHHPPGHERFSEGQRVRIEIGLFEEVNEADARQRHLLLGRPGSQDPKPLLMCSRDGISPEGRLPDPGLSTKYQRASVRGGRRDEGIDAFTFEAPTDHRNGRSRHHIMAPSSSLDRSGSKEVVVPNPAPD